MDQYVAKSEVAFSPSTSQLGFGRHDEQICVRAEQGEEDCEGPAPTCVWHRGGHEDVRAMVNIHHAL
jgi:hypothetical protein